MQMLLLLLLLLMMMMMEITLTMQFSSPCTSSADLRSQHTCNMPNNSKEPLTYTVKISLYSYVASFQYLMEPVPYTFVYVNRWNNEARASYLENKTRNDGASPT